MRRAGMVILLSKTGIVVEGKKLLKMQIWRRAILSEDSCQTQEELSESLDVAPSDFPLAHLAQWHTAWLTSTSARMMELKLERLMDLIER
nr:hypothetical protein HmN_000442100 [Hymenolepis microstoma]